jgi:NADPH-dependent curcumin reductase CurA
VPRGQPAPQVSQCRSQNRKDSQADIAGSIPVARSTAGRTTAGRTTSGLSGELLERATPWVRDGSLKHKEDIVDGLENAPEAFLGMLDGKNFGKLLVPVS